MIPAQASRAPQARFVLVETARAWLRYCTLPKYVFACPIHPASYYGVTRRAHRSWPRPGQSVPRPIATLMHELGESFGLQDVAGGGGLVREVGWITRESEEERAYWAKHQAPEVQFYRRTNPSYARGHGLLMLVPVTVPLVVRAVLGRGRELLTRGFRARRLVNTGSRAR